MRLCIHADPFYIKPESLRWEIVRLRAILDHERFVGKGVATPAAEAALLRLIELYHG